MTSVQIQIPFESLIEAITSLDLEKKHQLLEIIEDLVFEAEEEATEQYLQVLEEVKEARKAYQNGDYHTIEEYIKCQSQ
jgi:uncharacterized protein YerC